MFDTLAYLPSPGYAPGISTTYGTPPHENGKLLIETNITGRVLKGEPHGLFNSAVIAEEDVELVLRSIFAFADALFNYIDPYHRHVRFLYNALLIDIGYRVLEREPRERHGYTLSSIDNSPVTIYQTPRIVSLDDLHDPRTEIDYFMARLRRALQERH